MKVKKMPPLSPAEQEIMDHLWRLNSTTIVELLDAVNASRNPPISRNTLQTQISRLESKGWVERDDSNRAHLYTPAVKETKGRNKVLRELKRRFFSGSSVALVRCLVESGDMTDKELAELRQLVDVANRKGKS